MKCLKRNLTEFTYYPYTGLETDLNEDGLHTGEFHPEYGSPVSYKGNISSPSGSAVQAFDGLEVLYTHVLVMDDPKADIRENGYIVWNGKQYDVTAVRPSINSVTIGLQQRTADYGDQYHGTDEDESDDELDDGDD